MEFDLSQASLQWRDRLQAFFDKEVLPRHRDWAREVAARGEASFMPELQRKARAAGYGIGRHPDPSGIGMGALVAHRRRAG
jgi:alkylation response protein AidB-like acyl-CoA dehydrogenase